MDSLIGRIHRNLLLVSGVAIAGMTLAWMGLALYGSHREVKQMRSQMLEEQRQQLRLNMDLALNYVQSEIPTLEARSQAYLREQTGLAWTLVRNGLRTHPGLSRSEKVRLVAETLGSISYDEGRGYFFISGYRDGKASFPIPGMPSGDVLYPSGEGQGYTLHKAKDSPRLEAILTAHDSVARLHGEGFHHYIWTRPGHEGEEHPKTSFVRGIPELGIIIGTGSYDEDVKERLQQEVIAQLSKLKAGDDAYFVAGTWDGLCLLGTSPGKNIWHMRDPDGRLIIQETIALAKAGGGFMQHRQPHKPGAPASLKLGYVAGIPEWRWYVGIGRNIEGLDARVKAREREARHELLAILLFSLLLFSAVFALLNHLGRRHAYSIARDLHRFLDYLRHAGHRLDLMPVENIEHSELRQIAKDTNLMVQSLRHAQSEREDMLASLEAKNQELEHVLYIAGHDLRSPLVTIQGFVSELCTDSRELSELLAVDTLGEAQRKRLRLLIDDSLPTSTVFIERGIAKLDLLLQGVLRYGRAGRIQPECALLDMPALLEGCLKAMEYTLRSQEAQIVQETLIPCFADAVLVQQIFTNLLENAVKYRHEERPPAIRITSHLQGNHVVYVVHDNGIGIPENQLKEVFKLFVRTQQKNEAPGEGLGLAICLRLALRMGGQLWAESELSVGSRFYLSLPATPHSPGKSTPMPRSSEAPEATG